MLSKMSMNKDILILILILIEPSVLLVGKPTSLSIFNMKTTAALGIFAGWSSLAAAQSTTTAKSNPRCTTAQGCATILGSHILGSKMCTLASGTACAGSDLAREAYAYSQSLGGSSFGFDSAYKIYALSSPTDQTASLLNVRLRQGRTGCRGAAIRGFNTFDNTCFNFKSNTSSNRSTSHLSTASGKPTTFPAPSTSKATSSLIHLSSPTSVIASSRATLSTSHRTGGSFVTITSASPNSGRS